MKIESFIFWLLLTSCAHAQVTPYVQSDIEAQQVRIKNDMSQVDVLQQQLTTVQADLTAAQEQLAFDEASLSKAQNFDTQNCTVTAKSCIKNKECCSGVCQVDGTCQ